MISHSSFPYSLYLVISSVGCGGRDFLQVAELAMRGGVDLIQLREKDLPVNEYLEQAKRLKIVADQYNVPLIINDNPRVMHEVNAFGIHVGNSDASPGQIKREYGDNYMIGYSVEQLAQATSENAIHADYIAASPVFSTLTKKDTIVEWGIAGLRAIRALSDKPLVAIGNMNLYNVASVIRAGADCIAVVSAICAADDPEQAASEIKKIIIDEKKV